MTDIKKREGDVPASADCSGGNSHQTARGCLVLLAMVAGFIVLSTVLAILTAL